MELYSNEIKITSFYRSRQAQRNGLCPVRISGVTGVQNFGHLCLGALYNFADLYIQVNKKFKGGNIGIVEKAQETRFGMSLKYSRYIGIAS